MTNTHARQQVLEYFRDYLMSELNVDCEIYRTSPIPEATKAHINLIIDDETIGGDSDQDEVENTFETMVRVAPMVAEITITSKDARSAANNMAGYVEQAIAGDDESGEHDIKGAPIWSHLAATTSDQEDEGQTIQVTLSLIFQTSYRTSPGNPFTLI